MEQGELFYAESKYYILWRSFDFPERGTKEWNNPNEQLPCSGTDSHSASHELVRHVWKPKVDFSQSLIMNPILSQRIQSISLRNILILHPIDVWVSQISVFRFSAKQPLDMSSVSFASFVPRPLLPPWFDHNINIRRRIKKWRSRLRNFLYSPVNSSPLMSKYYL